MIALGPLSHNQLELFRMAAYITRYKQHNKIAKPNQAKKKKIIISKPSQMIALGPLSHNQLELFRLARYITRYKQHSKIAKPNQTKPKKKFTRHHITNDSPLPTES